MRSSNLDRAKEQNEGFRMCYRTGRRPRARPEYERVGADRITPYETG